MQEMIETLRGLIAIESVKGKKEEGKPFGKGAAEALEFFLAEAERLGFKAENFDGYAGHIDYYPDGEGRGKPAVTVGVLAHLDVMPAGGGWKFPPFGGVIADGRLYGRGATDDKGPAVACLYAMKRIKDEGLRLKNRLRLIVGCDEESGSECMKYYRKKCAMPDMGFSPDNVFPVTNYEKHILQIRITLPAGAELRRVKTMDCGTRVNVVPDLAEAVLKDGTRLRFKGRAAHAAEPHLGDNAIVKLLKKLNSMFMARLLNDAGKEAPLSSGGGRPSESRAETDGALDYLYRNFCKKSGEGFINALSRARKKKTNAEKITINLAKIKVFKEKVVITVDLRVPLHYHIGKVKCLISEGLPEGGKFSVLRFQKGLYASEDSCLVKILSASYERVTGDKAAPISTGGGTYARQLKTGVAFGPSLPGKGHNIHMPDEFIGLDELELITAVYYDALADLGNAEF